MFNSAVFNEDIVSKELNVGAITSRLSENEVRLHIKPCVVAYNLEKPS